MNYKLYRAYRRMLSTLMIVSSCHGFTSVDSIHKYMLANYYQFRGDYKKASSWYEAILSEENIPVSVYKGYLIFLYETESFAKIMALMPTVENAFIKDADMQLLLAHAYHKSGKQADFHEKILKLATLFPSHPDIVLQAAQVYATRKDLENGIKIIDTFLNTTPRRVHNFIFYFMKSQLCMQLDNKQEALLAVKQCLDVHPAFSKGWLLLALLEEQQGKLDQAIKGYTAFLELDNNKNVQIQQHLLQLTLRQQMTSNKNQHLFASLTSSFDKAVYYLNQKEYAKAIDYVDQCLENNPDNKDARFLKIQILSTMGKYVQAADLLKKWLLVDPNQEVWLKSLHLLCSKGLTYQKAVAVLEDIVTSHKESLEPLLYLIDISTRALAHDATIRYYKKALKLAQNKELKARLYFHMGQAYYKKNDTKKMLSALEKGHALGVHFPHLDNMLAYYYADKSRDLKRAQLILDALLPNNKTNPYFQDTQAFVYYKQKQYDKAVAILEPVVQKIPDNFYVLKHLGKAYYKLGFKEKARTLLEKAVLAAESENEKQKCTNAINSCNKSS